MYHEWGIIWYLFMGFSKKNQEIEKIKSLSNLPIYVRGFFCKEEQENRVKLLDRQPKGPFCLRHVDGRCHRLLYVNLAQQLISIDDSLSPTPSQFLIVCGLLRPCIIDYHFHLIVNRWHGILGRGFQFGSIIFSILCI